MTIRHSMEQFDYMQHLHELFEEFVVQPIHKGSNLDPRTKETYFWCNLHTLSFKCFAYYRTLFYNEAGVKIIPTNIGELLTPVGLAYWFMDDGHSHKASNGFDICTNGFTMAETGLLIEILKTNFDVDSKMHKGGIKDQKMRYIPASQKEKFRALVSPYAS